MTVELRCPLGVFFAADSLCPFKIQEGKFPFGF